MSHLQAAAIDMTPLQLGIVRKILQTYVPQYAVWAFGSRVTGKAKPYSDLDLVIKSNSPLSFEVTGNLADAFSESDLPWKVDVIDWSRTSDSFRRLIIQNYIQLQ